MGSEPSAGRPSNKRMHLSVTPLADARVAPAGDAQRYAYMRYIVAICLAAGFAAASVTSTHAYKPNLPLQFTEVAGEWVGQCDTGDVFRLELGNDQSGSLGYVQPEWKDDEVTVYEIADLQFDGFQLLITLEHPEWGTIVLKGYAREQFMKLRVKGLYHRTKPRVSFVRATAWESVLDRLRSEMKQ